MKNIHGKIATKIKRLLKTQGKSADRLALEIGMAKSYLYGFLAGKQSIGLKSLEKIADGLEVKIKDLFPDD